MGSELADVTWEGSRMGLSDWLKRRRVERESRELASHVTPEMLDALASAPVNEEWLRQRMGEERAKETPDQRAEREADEKALEELETRLRVRGIDTESDQLMEDYFREAREWEESGRERPTYREWLLDHANKMGWLGVAAPSESSEEGRAEDHPTAHMIAQTGLLGATAMAAVIGEPRYCTALLATVDTERVRLLIGEAGVIDDVTEHVPPSALILMPDDPDVQSIAEAALQTAEAAHMEGTDTGGDPIAAGIMMLTETPDQRWGLRLGFASRGASGAAAAEMLKGRLLGEASLQGWT